MFPIEVRHHLWGVEMVVCPTYEGAQHTDELLSEKILELPM